MSDDQRTLYRLMSWLSPSFPVGAYSYSHGIEHAVEAGLVADVKALIEWVEGLLAFFDRHLSDGSPTRRQLSTHVYSQAIAPKASELVVEPVGEAFFDPSPDMLVV